MPTEGFDTKATEIEELSEGQLSFGYWFVTHRAGLKKVGIGFIIAFIVLTFGYSIFALGRYYIFQYSEYQNALATAGQDYINLVGIRELNRIEPIEIISRHVIAAGTGKIDIAVRVRNPNTKWGLRGVDYQFSIGGTFYETQTGFLLPGEEKYFVALNVDGVSTGTPQVFFENHDWWRVTKFEEWGPERINFEIENKQFVSSRQSELSGQLPVSQLSANFVNPTAYNYDEILIQFALLSGNRLVGINQIKLRDIRSGEARPIVGRWTTQLPSVSGSEIIATVNILDETVYADFEGVLFP